MPEFFVVILVGSAVLLPFGLMAALAYDRLARRLHDSFPEAWRSAGGPIGYFWRPPGAPHPQSLWAFGKALMVWPFRLPPELQQDSAARRDQRFLRIGLILWNTGVIGLFALVIGRYGFPPRV